MCVCVRGGEREREREIERWDEEWDVVGLLSVPGLQANMSSCSLLNALLLRCHRTQALPWYLQCICVRIRTLTESSGAHG